MEEDVIWQLNDTYRQAIEESTISFFKKRRAKALLSQLTKENVSHRRKINSLINYERNKKQKSAD